MNIKQIEFTTNRGIQINGLSNINSELSLHYLVYKIDDLDNGKSYIGQHQTFDPLDDYTGSGTLIKLAVKSKPISNFIKTILYDFADKSLMDEKENELVQLSDCFPQNQLSYNLVIGGSQNPNPVLYGEANGMYGKPCYYNMTEEEKQSWYNNVVKHNREYAKNPEWRKKMSEVTSGKNNPMYGKPCFYKMTEDEIKQWKQHLSESARGENNPMYGKDSWAKCTEEERAARIEKFRNSIKGKNKGKKAMQLPGTNKVIFVLESKIQQYLDNGYLFSNTKGKKRLEIFNMKPHIS